VSQRPPVDRPPRPDTNVSSRVLVNTGDGKGKTTAALGTALRAVARGWRVVVIQFMKSERWKVGEERSGRALGIEWWTLGDGFTWDSKDMDRTEAVARTAWKAARASISSGDYGLIVLDEITYPMSWGWIATAEVTEAIRDRPPHTSIIATGRDAPDELMEAADTVTEMKSIRHAYDRGIGARRGIEF
jgi:cob(I)alamin adenosyltransferase